MPVGTKLSIAQNRIVMPRGTGHTHRDSYATASPFQILCRSVELMRIFGRFSIFQDGSRPPSWIFKSWKF